MDLALKALKLQVLLAKSTFGSREQLLRCVKPVVLKCRIFTASIEEMKEEKLLCRGLCKLSPNLEKIIVFPHKIDSLENRLWHSNHMVNKDHHESSKAETLLDLQTSDKSWEENAFIFQ